MAKVGKRPLRYCVSQVSLWTGFKRVSLSVALMMFDPHMVSRLRGSVKVMRPPPTWLNTSGSPSRPQASLSTTSSNMDTSFADETSVTLGHGCSYSPNGDVPARKRRKLPPRRQSTGGDLSKVHQSSANSRRRSERSLPLDDCGHRGDPARSVNVDWDGRCPRTNFERNCPRPPAR